jgi:hypothetical protein
MRPHFLVIGGQKCGTSWLQDNLSQHPQVWLPPIKEIHYFDQGNVEFHVRFLGTSKRMRKARFYAAKQFRAWLSGDTHELWWAINYWLAYRDDNWYRSLFPDRPDTITGEICPGYARLPEPAVAKVKSFVPSARIVYLLRNPIERSWSYAAQYFTSPRKKGRYVRLANVPPDVLHSFLERDAQGHSNYLGALDAWQRHFGDQLLVGYFDELKSDPELLFRRVIRFLNIKDSQGWLPSGLCENRHPSRDAQMPHEYRSYLAKLHLPSLKELHSRLRSKETEEWLAKASAAQH